MKQKQPQPLLPETILLKRDLDDLPGELWDDIPGMDGIGRISNIGRVKRMGYQSETANGRLVTYKERIQKIKLARYINQFLGEPVDYATARIQVEKRTHTIAIGRLVYYCFVEKFDLNNRALLVVHNDHNSLNNRADNLKLTDYSGFQRHVMAAGRKDQHFGHNLENQIAFSKIGRQQTSKPISKYSMEGALLDTYGSVTEAAAANGITLTAVSAVANKKALAADGQIYRFGEKGQINTSKIKRAIEKLKGKPISMYNMDGIKLKTFQSINAASRQLGFPAESIRKVAQGKARTAKGAIWRYGHSEKVNVKPVHAALQKWKGCILSQYDLQGKKVATFQSAKAASFNTGINMDQIMAHASRNDLILKGHIWRLGDAGQIPKSSFKNAREYQGKTRPLELTQYDQGGKRKGTFQSAAEAAKATGISPGCITTAANGYKTTGGGFFWRRGDGPRQIPILPRHTEPGKKAQKAVSKYAVSGEYLCTYPSIKAAARDIDGNNSSISAALRKGSGTSGGFKWKEVKK